MERAVTPRCPDHVRTRGSCGRTRGLSRIPALPLTGRVSLGGSPSLLGPLSWLIRTEEGSGCFVTLLEGQRESRCRGTGTVRVPCKQPADVAYGIVIIVLHADVKTRGEAAVTGQGDSLEQTLPLWPLEGARLPTPQHLEFGRLRPEMAG